MTAWDEVLRTARELWGAGLAATPENIHAAAVGLASGWYRNTDAVETHAHACGPWSDLDMLRNNAWATELSRRALDGASDAGADVDRVGEILAHLLDELSDLLPNARARRSLHREKRNAPDVAVSWIEANGFGNWLTSLSHAFLYPNDWWGAPGFAAVVEQLCALEPGPPDPETFRERLLRMPWELTNDQAEFVCAHRYDIGRR